MNQKCYLVAFTFLLLFGMGPVFAAKSHGNVACPVDTPYTDGSGNPVSFQEKFGDDVLEDLRCNKRRSKVRMVMQVNLFKQGGKPYGFRNLDNIKKDFEITHGIDNWKIAIVIHSGGSPFVEVGNEYEGLVQENIDDPNVDIYYCLNTAAAKGQTTEDIIYGIKFVPAGLSAIMDFQYQGYKYIQP